MWNPMWNRETCLLPKCSQVFSFVKYEPLPELLSFTFRLFGSQGLHLTSFFSSSVLFIIGCPRFMVNLWTSTLFCFLGSDDGPFSDESRPRSVPFQGLFGGNLLSRRHDTSIWMVISARNGNAQPLQMELGMAWSINIYMNIYHIVGKLDS